MYKDRQDLFKAIEKKRGSILLTYVTGDRQGMETQINVDALDLIAQHLDATDKVDKVSLLLYTRGGATLAAYSMVELIGQFCTNFEVLIPSKAQSAGTLIALGANSIVMTKQATLGPIDPSVNGPLNPVPPNAPPGLRVPVSVEAINGYIELVKQAGGDVTQALSILSDRVHPLVLGEVYRSRGQIRMLGKRLLSKHIKSEEQIERIVSFLCSDSGSHDYNIYRNEARESLGLNIEKPDDELYLLLKQLFDSISSELKLTQPFNSLALLENNQSAHYEETRAIIESIKGGSHQYISKGTVGKVQVNQGAQIQQGLQDNRIFEGWRYEKAI